MSPTKEPSDTPKEPYQSALLIRARRSECGAETKFQGARAGTRASDTCRTCFAPLSCGFTGARLEEVFVVPSKVGVAGRTARDAAGNKVKMSLPDGAAFRGSGFGFGGVRGSGLGFGGVRTLSTLRVWGLGFRARGACPTVRRLSTLAVLCS